MQKSSKTLQRERNHKGDRRKRRTSRKHRKHGKPKTFTPAGKGPKLQQPSIDAIDKRDKALQRMNELAQQARDLGYTPTHFPSARLVSVSSNNARLFRFRFSRHSVDLWFPPNAFVVETATGVDAYGPHPSTIKRAIRDKQLALEEERLLG